MGFNCQSLANDCNVNATAFLHARLGSYLLLEMRSEEKVRSQGRLPEHVGLHLECKPGSGRSNMTQKRIV